MSELLRKQLEFAEDIVNLLNYALHLGYKFKFGESIRTKEQAILNAKKGTGIMASLHIDSLAQDILLFMNGVYLKDTQSYELLGVFWKNLRPGENMWGGDFTRADGNHFSRLHNGRK
jgi:hypothetical protein